jgi:hypothetical protein
MVDADRSALAALAQTLENSFYGLDREAILAKIARRRETADQRQALAAVSGIDEGRVLDLLVDLGITAESFAALTLAPLVAVAWADGRVDAKERDAILAAANDAGLDPTELSYMLLSGRLAEPPPEQLMEAWHAYAAMLKQTLSPADLADLKRNVLDRARQVAEASRGRLGLGPKISREERALLDELERAFA